MSAFLWDVHACPPKWPHAGVARALERYRAIGAGAVTLNAGDSTMSLEDVMRTVALYRAAALAHPHRYRIVGTSRELDEARAAGLLAITFDVEGALSLGEQVEAVDAYAAFGVRWMSFAYNRANAFASGCHDERDGGLTALGRRLCERLDALGVIKCGSHCSYRTALEVFEASPKPCILSHSNARRLVDQERNVPDEVMLACARTGGVVGINGIGLFLGADRPGVEEFFAHVDYAVSLVGADHVAIGLDCSFPAEGGGDVKELQLHDERIWPARQGYGRAIACMQPETLPAVAQRMERAGYPAGAIAGIMGENFARVARAVWPTK